MEAEPEVWLLDTCILIDALRGRDEARHLLDDAEASFLISAVTVAELYAGVRPEEEAAMANFLRAFHVVAVDRDVAEQAGRWRQTFGRSHGVSIADALIAATAAAQAARLMRLMTCNVRHFPMFEGLTAPY